MTTTSFPCHSEPHCQAAYTTAASSSIPMYSASRTRPVPGSPAPPSACRRTISRSSGVKSSLNIFPVAQLSAAKLHCVASVPTYTVSAAASKSLSRSAGSRVA
eukprot:42808-Eustigmatos_ZCMA.PRE.1